MVTCEECDNFIVYKCDRDQRKLTQYNPTCNFYMTATCVKCRHFVIEYLNHNNICLKHMKSISPDNYRCSYFINRTSYYEITCDSCEFFEEKISIFKGKKYICRRVGSGREDTSPGNKICDLYVEH